MSDAPLTFELRSGRTRFGLKGPNAAQWLASRGVALPAQPNRWLPYADGACLRLGVSEYFLDGAAEVEALATALRYESGVYPVLRQDAAWQLGGTAVGAVLEQVCGFDVRAAAARDADAVVLTSLLGISMQVIWQGDDAARVYRLWCDTSYTAYVAATLGDIVRELGGQVFTESGREGRIG